MGSLYLEYFFNSNLQYERLYACLSCRLRWLIH